MQQDVIFMGLVWQHTQHIITVLSPEVFHFLVITKGLQLTPLLLVYLVGFQQWQDGSPSCS